MVQDSQDRCQRLLPLTVRMKWNETPLCCLLVLLAMNSACGSGAHSLSMSSEWTFEFIVCSHRKMDESNSLQLQTSSSTNRY